MKRLRSTRRHPHLGGSILFGLFLFTLGFAAGNHSVFHTIALSDTDQAFEAFWEALAIIEERYIDQMEALVDGAISGMVAALGDDYSGYIRPALFKRSIDFSGEFTGIGVFVATNDETGDIRVSTVIPETPAEAVGVLPGDIFYEVDGQRVTDYTQAELQALVPGPRGTSVTITFKRGAALVTYEIERDTFPLPNVSYNIAHIAMLDFNDLSRQQLDDAFAAVDINNTKGLIFDIRNNHGGTLGSAIEIGSAFIEDGVLLRQVARDGSEEITRSSGGYVDIDVPIVVLVDENSASAAEVVAGAMRDYGVATIMGEVTFGKGTVQNVPELSNGGGLRITVRRWLTPKGHWIHQQGIEPDIIAEWDPQTEAERANDIQLAAAIEFLESLRD